jgi:hypothetical protein
MLQTYLESSLKHPAKTNKTIINVQITQSLGLDLSAIILEALRTKVPSHKLQNAHQRKTIPKTHSFTNTV